MRRLGAALWWSCVLGCSEPTPGGGHDADADDADAQVDAASDRGVDTALGDADADVPSDVESDGSFDADTEPHVDAASDAAPDADCAPCAAGTRCVRGSCRPFGDSCDAPRRIEVPAGSFLDVPLALGEIATGLTSRGESCRSDTVDFYIEVVAAASTLTRISSDSDALVDIVPATCGTVSTCGSAQPCGTGVDAVFPPGGTLFLLELVQARLGSPITLRFEHLPVVSPSPLTELVTLGGYFDVTGAREWGCGTGSAYDYWFTTCGGASALVVGVTGCGTGVTTTYGVESARAGRIDCGGVLACDSIERTLTIDRASDLHILRVGTGSPGVAGMFSMNVDLR